MDKASPSAPYLHPGGLAQLRVVTQGPVAGLTDDGRQYGGGSTGGVLPFLMITVAPVLAVVYAYSFGFRTFDPPQDS